MLKKLFLALVLSLALIMLEVAIGEMTDKKSVTMDPNSLTKSGLVQNSKDLAYETSLSLNALIIKSSKNISKNYNINSYSDNRMDQVLIKELNGTNSNEENLIKDPTNSDIEEIFNSIDSSKISYNFIPDDTIKKMQGVSSDTDSDLKSLYENGNRNDNHVKLGEARNASGFYASFDSVYSNDMNYNIVTDNAISATQNARSNINSDAKYLYEKGTENDGQIKLSRKQEASGFYSNFDSVYSNKINYNIIADNTINGTQNVRSNIDSYAKYFYGKKTGNGGQIRLSKKQDASEFYATFDSVYSNKMNYNIVTDNNVKATQNVGSDTGSDLNYVYRKGVGKGGKVEPSAEHVTYDVNAVLNYLYLDAIIRSNNPKSTITTGQNYIAEMINKLNLQGLKVVRDPYVDTVPCYTKDVSEVPKPSKDSSNTNLNEIWPTILNENDIDYFSLIKNIKDNDMSRDGSHKNYALIIGINRYSDRMSLSNCVNDANAIADILTSCGYEVIKLTDETENKPTKNNILNGALTEMNLKKNRGNVLFYFSGHSEKDQNGNFYLIPQDADGNPSSFINENELKEHLCELNHAAIIIDACNSGELKHIIKNNQIIIASSRENEPSNEDWIKPYSVFTYYLCEAFKEEKDTNDHILLQSCFSMAYNDTVQWSKDHLLSQTPIIDDASGGRYYLNN